jgi:hypothetical protein
MQVVEEVVKEVQHLEVQVVQVVVEMVNQMLLAIMEQLILEVVAAVEEVEYLITMEEVVVKELLY